MGSRIRETGASDRHCGGGQAILSLKYPPQNLGELAGDLQRIALGAAYALRLRRLAVLPYVAMAVLKSAVGLERPGVCVLDEAPQPNPAAGGFVGLCGALDPDELMAGYRKGYFPSGHVGRKKWWLRPERMVMSPDELVVEKDVRRLLKNDRFRVSFDTAFTDVVLGCAEPRPGQVPLTWITRDVVAAFERLHREGHAHSFEVWNAANELVGGGFGIAVGPVFVIKSQFTRERNASKVGMATLLTRLETWGFRLIDGMAYTPHLERLGFHLIPHAAYAAIIASGPANVGPVGSWHAEAGPEALEQAALPAKRAAADKEPGVPDADDGTLRTAC